MTSGLVLRGVGSIASGNPPSTPFTWDVANSHASITFGESDRLLVDTTAAEVFARTTGAGATGKVEAQFLLTFYSGVWGIGLADTTASNATYLGGSGFSAAGFFSDTTYVNGAGVAVNNALVWPSINGTPTGADPGGTVITLLHDRTLGEVYIKRDNVFGTGQDPAGINLIARAPWLTVPTGKTWAFASDIKNGNECQVRVPATAPYAVTSGYTLLNA